MRKTKMMFVSLLAMFAVGVVASASASAELWSINGSTAFGTAAISSAGIPLTGDKVEGDGIALSCRTLKIEGGLIKEGNTGMATSLTFSECEELNDPTKCALSSSTIVTNPVTIDIFNATEIEIAPEGTTEFTTKTVVNKAGKTCTLKGQYIDRGALRATVGNAATEEKEHELAFNSKSKLEINSNVATIQGSGKIKLASGEPWAIMTP